MIYPSQLPPNYPRGSYEDYYFHRFREELAPEYTVYYSAKLVTPDVSLRELDFVVVGPEGILVIELKNVRYRMLNERWQSFVRGEWQNFVKYLSPLEQARSATSVFKKFLDNRFLSSGQKNKVSQQSVGYVVFLLQNSAQDLPPLPHLVFVDRLEKYHLEDIVASLWQECAIRPLADGQEQVVNEIIINNLNYSRNIMTKRKRQEQELVSLTREQYSVLYHLSQEGRILMEGIAGSGKTLVALEAARRESRLGKKVLFVCFSSNLAAYLARQLDGEKAITIKTLASLAREIILAGDPDFFTSKGNRHKRDQAVVQEKQRDPHRTFEREVLAQKAIKYIDSYSLSEPYDFVVVDEGQDILADEPLLLLDSLLRGGFDSGRWLVAYDKHQALYGDIEQGINYLLSSGPVTRYLEENIRTPKNIFWFAMNFLSSLQKSSVAARLSDITGLSIVYYKNHSEGLAKLEEILEYAVTELKFRPEQITVLSDRRRSKNEVFGGKGRKIGRFNIINYEKGKGNKGYVNYCEISRYKGLENGFVLFVGEIYLDDSEMRRQYFVALSRATSAAALLIPSRNKKTLEEFL